MEFNDEHLKQTAELAQIRKLYKLDAPDPSKAGKTKSKKGTDADDNTPSARTNGVHKELDDVREMEAVILGIMALKGS